MSAHRLHFRAGVGALILALAACSPGESGDMQEADQPAAGGMEPAAEVAAGQDLSSCFIQGATPEETQERPSPLHTTQVTLGGEQATLCYGAPSVRGRQIFGSLEEWDQPWRMGANEATGLHLPFAAEIGGVAVEPGDYSLWAVPGQEQWEIHVNGNAERWGIPIDGPVQSADVGSFTVTPGAPDGMVETLRYSWEQDGEGAGRLVMEWANTRLEIPVSLPSGSGM
jgi:hypothetical protein